MIGVKELKQSHRYCCFRKSTQCVMNFGLESACQNESLQPHEYKRLDHRSADLEGRERKDGRREGLYNRQML